MSLNPPDLLVSVHGYDGDKNQIQNALRFYEHHQAPVVIFSPEDSKISRMGPHICRFIGRRQYIGQLSLDRQKAQLAALLDYTGFNWFLMNDSDSICVEPKLPAYLFESPETLWSNSVSDAMHARPENYPYPRLAFQPPYFCHRSVIQKLISVDVPADPTTPFIDWWMMSVAIEARVPFQNFRDGISCPTSDEGSLAAMSDAVTNRGAIFLHSIKTLRALNQVVGCRKYYVRKFGIPQHRAMPRPIPPGKGVWVRFDQRNEIKR
jgi:hypothetical protein